MRKGELAAAMAERAGLSKSDAGWILNVILDELTLALAQGEDISLPGFGSFVLRDRAARMGKNPQTGAPLEIAASRSVGFRPGKGLRDAVALGSQA